MKHIKTYKLFESSSEEVKNYIKDIFLDIQDEEIEFDIEGRWIRTRDFEELTGYKVMIGDGSRRPGHHRINGVKTFKLKDVYDSIQMAKSYMSDEGFFLVELKGMSPDKYGDIETYGLLYGFDLYQNGHVDKLFDKPLVYLEIDFRKSK